MCIRDRLQCVQTLTRANRIFEGKTAESIFILDFQNTIEDIKEAFKPYFEVTELESLTQPEQIYDLKNLIDGAGFIEPESIESFCETFFKPDLTTTDRAYLEGLINQTVNSYKTAGLGEQNEFRQAVKSFCRFYNFIGQVFQVADLDLEKFYWYCDWLSKKLMNTKQEAVSYTHLPIIFMCSSISFTFSAPLAASASLSFCLACITF